MQQLVHFAFIVQVATSALAEPTSTQSREDSSGAQRDAALSETPYLPGSKWRVHDEDRPHPAVIIPGQRASEPPSDAIILFDGNNLDAWHSTGAPWLMMDGVLTVPPREKGKRSSSLVSKESFGDIQLHLEYRSPKPPTKSGQDRGNSGIMFMQRYELQILDSYHNPSYADGMAASIYGWKPPLVNASRPPGEWQSFDIIFERPHFTGEGTVTRPAYITAFLNGVLVHNRQLVLGTTVWRRVAKYEVHADAAPLQLQDHGSPVSFRNIWVRKLQTDAIAQ